MSLWLARLSSVLARYCNPTLTAGRLMLALRECGMHAIYPVSINNIFSPSAPSQEKDLSVYVSLSLRPLRMPVWMFDNRGAAPRLVCEKRARQSHAVR